MKLRKLFRLAWRVAKRSWQRDKRAFADLSQTLAAWSEVKVPGPKAKKQIARRYRVKAHTRADGTRVKAHWRVK